MGLKMWLIKRAMKKASSKSDLEKVADETLKDALKELQQTSKTANKILQAKLIRQESRHALTQINELDEEFNDEDAEEADAPETMEDKISGMLINKFLGGAANAGNPAANQTPEELSGVNMGQIAEVAKNLSPQDIEALKKQFLG